MASSREMNVNETKVNLRPLKPLRGASITTNQPRVTRRHSQIGVLAEGPVGKEISWHPQISSQQSGQSQGNAQHLEVAIRTLKKKSVIEGSGSKK